MTENQWPQDGSQPEPSAPQRSAPHHAHPLHSAADSAGTVAHTARNEAANVAAEAKSSAQDLLGEVRSGLTGQAMSQQRKAASGIRSFSDQLNTMAMASDQPGVASDLVRQAAERSAAAAAWLAGKDPGSLLDEATSFARRRPGTFLLLAAGAGVLAGRLTRGLSAGAPASSGTSGRFVPAAGGAVPPPQVDLPAPEAASGRYVPPAGAFVPPRPVDLPGPDAATAGLGGAASDPAPRTANPLDSPQLAEDRQSRTHLANDPLAGKELADDPMGSDPLTRDRSNPG
ncbi:MAG: hypothetical protein QOH40_352 [Arthrobacter pascens]|nr:hypothetical protein [Arthrobacter pascens]